jgi:Na+/H+-translocating membrane pyrophosphatase
MLKADGAISNWRSYVLVGILAAAAGGLGVALATRAAARTAAAVASAVMSRMAARMRDGSCQPPAI